MVTGLCLFVGLGARIYERVTTRTYNELPHTVPEQPNQSALPTDTHPIPDTTKQFVPAVPSEKEKTRTTLGLNHATAEELQKIKGIGPKLSKAIVKHRLLKGPFNDLSDLLHIKGIGPVKLAKIKPFLHL